MTSNRISQLSTFVTLVLGIAAGVVQAQTFSVLYDFGSNSGDPSKPAYSGIVAQGRDGNLYSTAPAGGTCCGAVFQITPAGKLKNIHNFTGSNETLSNVGFQLSPTLIPLDNLNFGADPPPGAPGSTYMPLPSFDGTSLSPGDGNGSPGGSFTANLPEPTSILLLATGLVGAAGCLRKRRVG